MKKYTVILLTSLWIFSSCADKLNLAPANQITQEQIMAILASGNEAQIDVVLGSIAGAIPTWIHRVLGGSDSRTNSLLNLQYVNNLQGSDIVLGLDATSFGWDAYGFVGKDGRNAINGFNTTYWGFGWKCVAEANRLLDFLPDEVVGESKKLKNYKASALTLRAFAYNFLMENYRGAYRSDGEGLMIYDKLGGDYKPFSTAGDTYDFIKQDLADAVRLFGESGIGEDGDGYTVANTADIDLTVANFVRARVSLLTGDYATAISACNAVLAKYPNLIAVENYGGKNAGTDDALQFPAVANAFLSFADNKNPEVIFGFADVNDSRNASSTWMNVFGLGLGGETGEYARIVNTLYDRIAPNDVRKGAFLGNATIPNYEYLIASGGTSIRTVPSYSNLKFAATHGLDGKKESASLNRFDICYMRTSEVLLMKAEAQAKNNDDAGAKATLNTLLAARTASGETLTCDNYGMTGSVLDMVKLQWRIEMWGENGLEYYNNKRWGVDAVRTPDSNHRNNITITVEKMTLDIPDNERLYNPNLN
ncbi:MAG: RagB/SusD family nutrient uptake outer membrane protein [Tannerella sp.]|jgi:hypothetical protein|nr:RagB/SusD family nutrient uptake outer membrane protein [Tannerella sp.]